MIPFKSFKNQLPNPKLKPLVKKNTRKTPKKLSPDF